MQQKRPSLAREAFPNSATCSGQEKGAGCPSSGQLPPVGAMPATDRIQGAWGERERGVGVGRERERGVCVGGEREVCVCGGERCVLRHGTESSLA